MPSGLCARETTRLVTAGCFIGEASIKPHMDKTNKMGVGKQPIKEEDKTNKMGEGEQPLEEDQERWSDLCYRSMWRTAGGIRAFLYGENIV